eukprot:scaffold272703_cov17-Prasinocladus_malaysianus.AAC.1
MDGWIGRRNGVHFRFVNLEQHLIRLVGRQVEAGECFKNELGFHCITAVLHYAISSCHLTPSLGPRDDWARTRASYHTAMICMSATDHITLTASAFTIA